MLRAVISAGTQVTDVNKQYTQTKLDVVVDSARLFDRFVGGCWCVKERSCFASSPVCSAMCDCLRAGRLSHYITSQWQPPRPTQPSIPPGSVNEHQLWLGKQRQVWLIPIADERVGVQVKLW